MKRLAWLLLLSPLTAMAGDLRDAFDYYKSNSSATYEVNGMHGWTGPSFRLRNNITNPQVVSFQPPSLSAGCSGIDGFTGSFSLITKDEIVQVGRAIVQGAPGYFFNLAVDSVCPTCGAQMRELQRKLESYNALTQDACNSFWDMATNKDKGLADRADAQRAGKGGLIEVDFGFVPDYAAAKEKLGFSKEVSPEVRDVVETNIVFDATKDKVKLKATITELTPEEMMMSLFGSATVKYKDSTGSTDDQSTPTLKPIDKRLNMYDVVFNEQDGKIKVWTCDPDSTAPGCKDVVPTERDFPGLLQKYQALIGSDDLTCPGVLVGIHRRTKRADFCEEPRQFANTFQFSWNQLAEQFTPAQYASVANHMSLIIARETITDFYTEQKKALMMATAPGNDLGNTGSQEDIDRLMLIADAEYQKTTDEIDRLINESLKHLQTMVALVSLSKML